MTGLTGVSLFAGIGGIDLAMERSGIRVTAMCEIDKDCQKLLRRNFTASQWTSYAPELFPDVKELTADDILATGFEPATGILTAGWPCQGNSVAGLRQGLDDPRSGLWRHVARLLGGVRPRWFIGENVPGLLTVRNGADFRQVLQDLDGLGYGVAWRVLDAQYLGVPQQRRRVIIAGCLGDPARAAQILLEPEGGGRSAAPGSEAPAEAAGRIVVSTLQGGGKRGYRVDAEAAAGGHLLPVTATGQVVSCLTARLGKGVDSDANFIVADATGVRRLTPLECERLQGFPDGWTDGQSDAARYRQLGNAVAVPVAEWVMRRLVASESARMSTRSEDAA